MKYMAQQAPLEKNSMFLPSVNIDNYLKKIKYESTELRSLLLAITTFSSVSFTLNALTNNIRVLSCIFVQLKFGDFNLLYCSKFIW